jgi:hypothetical protein
MVITVHTDTTVYQVSNNAQTTLTADIDTTQTSIPLTNTARFSADGGYAVVVSTDDVTPGEEILYYAGKTGSQLTGVIRGQDGTTAKNADQGDTVEVRDFAQHHNAVAQATKTTSSDLRNLSIGTETFTALVQDDSGSTFDGRLEISSDAVGHTQMILDQNQDGSALKIGRRNGTGADLTDGEALLWIGNGPVSQDEVTIAADIHIYTSGNNLTGAQETVTLRGGVADAGGVEAFKFKTINDISAGDWNLSIYNQGTLCLGVRKDRVQAVKLYTNQPLNLPVASVNPSTPENGDTYLFNSGGVRQLRAFISGVWYATTLT